MKVVRDPSKPQSPFRVSVPATITGSRRVRRWFGTQSDAKLWIRQVQVHGWEAASGAAETDSNDGLRLSDLAETWVARSRHLDRVTVRQLELVCRALVRGIGDPLVERITHRELDDYFRSMDGSLTTRRNHHRIAKRLFAFAHDWMEVIPRNPMVKVARPGHGDPPKRKILTPQDCKAALEASARLGEWKVYRSIVLGSFCGLRTCEIQRLEWCDIDRAAKEVHVRQPKRSRGHRPRFVTINETAEAWMGEGFDAASDKRVCGLSSCNLRIRRKVVTAALGWPRWPENCLRHSFGTYHLAAYQNAALTAHEMGHTSPQTTMQHYAVAAKRADAADWWSLHPNAR